MALTMSFPQMYALAYGVQQNFLKNNILSGTTMAGSTNMVYASRKFTQTPTVKKTNLQTVFTPGIDYGTSPEIMNYLLVSGAELSTIADTVDLVPTTQNFHSILGAASVADKYLDMYTGCNFTSPGTINIIAIHWNLHVTGLGILKKLK